MWLMQYVESYYKAHCTCAFLSSCLSFLHKVRYNIFIINTMLDRVQYDNEFMFLFSLKCILFSIKAFALGCLALNFMVTLFYVLKLHFCLTYKICTMCAEIIDEKCNGTIRQATWTGKIIQSHMPTHIPTYFLSKQFKHNWLMCYSVKHVATLARTAHHFSDVHIFRWSCNFHVYWNAS